MVKNYSMFEQPEQQFYSSMELIKIFPEAKIYLQEMKEQYERWLPMVEDVVRRQFAVAQKSKNPEFWEGIVGVLSYGRYLEFLEGELKRIDLFLFEPVAGDATISPSEIEIARNYPFNLLIGSPKEKGFIKCPLHEETKPSFYFTSSPGNSRGHCFSCGKSFDTIAYLMEVHGHTFQEAVKRLN